MPATARQLQQFLASLEPGLAKAFNDAVESIRARSNIGALESAIQALDYEAAFYAAGIRDYSWVYLTEGVRDAYLTAGAFTVAAYVPARFGLDFNINNPRAQQWLATYSSEKIVVEFDRGQRAAIRQIIANGFDLGDNPRTTALDIVGRVSKQTGRRSGGVIGLHEQFSDAVINARKDLRELNPNYFNRVRRDKRFDKAVRESFASGKPLSKEMIERISNSYENSLLKLRADNIARTESLSAMNAAADEALQQTVDEGLAEADAIEKIWDSSGDARTREDHRRANGQTVKLGELFVVGGYPMKHPGDTNAPASQTVNCRCIVRHKIDFSRTAL